MNKVGSCLFAKVVKLICNSAYRLVMLAEDDNMPMLDKCSRQCNLSKGRSGNCSECSRHCEPMATNTASTLKKDMQG